MKLELCNCKNAGADSHLGNAREGSFVWIVRLYLDAVLFTK
jgi:hypothetical protein